MHKKPLVAVLILGLLLLLPSFADAAKDPGQTLQSQGQLLPYIARNLVKDPVGSTTPVGAPTAMQMGVSRTGATFCSGDGQGGALGQYGSWFYGAEFYAFYQDPEEFGSCDGLSGLYTFDVTEITWWVVSNTPALFNIDMQPLVYENAGDFACPLPGNVLCAGPLYNVDLTGAPGGGYLLGLPIAAECCVFDPYFAGIYAATFVGSGVLGIVVDNDGATDCWMYNDYGGGWEDLSVDWGFVGDIMLWSEGDAYDQNSCPGLPGECAFQGFYTGTAYFWQAPDDNLANHYFVRFDADKSCTLQGMQFRAYGGGEGGADPLYRISVYGVNGPVFAGRPYPDAVGVEYGANYVGSIDVASSALAGYPAWDYVDLTPLGTIVATAGQSFFVTVGLSPNTPDPVNDIASILSDDGGTPTGHCGFWVGAFSDWYYNDEVFANDYDWQIEGFICCEIVEVEEEACSAPGPDDWNTWCHDYSRTSATTIEVGDPCEVTAQWSANLANLNSFCEPTVANDRVYISSDGQTRVYNLGTGALINTVTGLPHIFSTNRGNVTIEGTGVYLTGGSGQSIGRWDLDLSANVWVNGIPAFGIGPLGSDTRFGAVTVYDAGGTEIAVVGTVGGRLYALNAATGALYPGWAPNPKIMDFGVYHGAAYDGAGLYVGTANASNSDGSIYRLDPLTGATVWQTLTTATDAFPAGVSLDVDHVYASSTDPGNLGRRYKLDKATGAILWEFGEGRSLYGTPAIGRNMVYISQDVGGVGVLAIDKISGAPIYNFANDGVADVPQPVTITCDNYIFAGDRLGKWWLLDAFNLTAVWGIDVPNFSIVNGTAVASHSNGDNYAVVSFRSSSPTGTGTINAFRFNEGPRPRVNQLVYETTIPVEFGLTTGNPWNEPDVFSNVGCADLTFDMYNYIDIAPEPAASHFNRTQGSYAAAAASRMIDGDFNAYFDNSNMSKGQARTRDLVSTELMRADAAKDEALVAMNDSKRASSRMAAAYPLLRTSAAVATSPLAPGAMTDVDWLYDGTDLARGFDAEEIEFITNDPDKPILGNHPILTILYAGGCLPAREDLHFGYIDEPNGIINIEAVYNDGHLGDDVETDDLIWEGEENQDIYEAGFFLAGEEDLLTGNKEYHIANLYEDNFPRLFLPDPFPGPTCEFQGDVDVLLGYKRDGCPGTPVEIRGEWVRTAFIDTNEARVGTPQEAIGTRIELTEIGAYDPLYGDFKIQHFEVTNRDAVAKGPIYGGSFYDWDVSPDFDANTGNFSLQYNGYAIWDHDTPDKAFGIFDPNLPTAACGLDPTFNRPQRINPMGERTNEGGPAEGGYDGPFQSGDADPWEELWDYSVERLPQFEYGPVNVIDDPSPYEDHFGLITLKGQILPASGTIQFNQVLYAVDATSNDFGTIEGLGLEVAQRAAKWCGFARGDVNDDGDINLLDACWLLSGEQIYPDTYNGDVNLSGGAPDAADQLYLLNYVTGLGPAPLGAWRFAL